MLVTSALIFIILCKASKMSFFQKLMRRKSKSDSKEIATNSFKTESDAVKSSGKEINSLSKINVFEPRSFRRKEGRDGDIPDISSDTDDDSEDTSEEFGDQVAENSKLKLISQIYKLRKQRDKLRRRQTDILTIEKEIREVIALIAATKQQAAALKEDLLNKKCELKFLASEVPEGYEIEAKKKESVFYKKYCNVKTTIEARDLLGTVRQKIKVLQYIELLTYNKYLECKHETKSSSVKNRSNILSKNKKRHFGPLMDAIQFASAEKNSPPRSNAAEQGAADDIPLQTIVTIEPSTTPEAPPTPSPFQGPLLPAHLIRGPLSLASSANMTPETIV